MARIDQQRQDTEGGGMKTKPPVFKVGDRVRYTPRRPTPSLPTNALGTVVQGPKSARGQIYVVAFDHATNGLGRGSLYDSSTWGPQGMRLADLSPANE